MRVLCVLPSFNEEKTIGWIVHKLKAAGYGVIVVDDGSRDQTAKVARHNGAEVMVNRQNLGKGASLRKAFAALKDREDYDVVIMMDADGQHLPSDIPEFIKQYRHDHPGLIVGNRMARAKGMPVIRWLTNSFMSFILSKMCRQPIPDSQCGFRLVSKPLLKSMQLNTENFEIESEMLLVAYRLGFPIESVPITTVYEGQDSAIHPIKDTLRFIRFVWKKQ